MFKCYFVLKLTYEDKEIKQKDEVPVRYTISARGCNSQVDHQMALWPNMLYSCDVKAQYDDISKWSVLHKQMYFKDCLSWNTWHPKVMK